VREVVFEKSYRFSAEVRNIEMVHIDMLCGLTG
jgi:hypothetical protein